MRINKNISRNILCDFMLNFLNWYHEKCFSATRTDIIEILEVITIRLNKKYKIKYYNNIFQAKTSPPPPLSASLKVLHDIMEVYNYLLTRG